NMEIFGELFWKINQEYTDETSPTDLMRTGIDAMLGSLDPYTNYYSESQIEYSRLIQSGQYSGIGAELDRNGQHIIFSELVANGPADEAGLRVGDRLLQIDEVIIDSSLNIDQARSLILGEEGSLTQIQVRRGTQELALNIKRGSTDAQQENVPYHGMVNDSIGYILQTGFTRSAASEVAGALQALMDTHQLKGLILDLRSNPGGLLDQAVAICNLFVPQGELIVEMRGRSQGTQNKFRTLFPPLALDLPVAVIVNGSSASASEIVAGGIQDLDRGIIVGQKSFGKGLVQNVKRIDPYNIQMKITVAKYYTPSGRCIQAIDYSRRNEDGSVDKVADSLIQEFSTRNGRLVYDGGGVDPDIKVEKQPYQPVIEALLKQQLIFDFATQFADQTESIDAPRTFNVTPDIYEQFVQFVQGKNFTFSTESEAQLIELASQTKREGYEEVLDNQINKIQDQIALQKEKDLRTHKA
ncbi:MAG: S41 family peptidase, partial [Bacteroidota bacterium]